MKKAAYAVFGLLVVLGYSAAVWSGLAMTGPTHRQYVPGGLRGASHGGYRSFWYTGFHGGK